MNAQQGLNQILDRAVIAARLGPNFEHKQEVRAINRDIDRVDKAGKADVKKYGNAATMGIGYMPGLKDKAGNELDEKMQEAIQSTKTERLAQKTELTKKLYDLEPNAINSNKLEKIRQRAQRNVQMRYDMKRIQKAEFDSYMNRLGGNQ